MIHGVTSTLNTVDVIVTAIVFVVTNAVWAWRWSRRLLSGRGGWTYVRLVWFIRSDRVRFGSSSLLSVPDGVGGYLTVCSKKPHETYWAPGRGVLKTYLSARDQLRRLHVVIDGAGGPRTDTEHDLRVRLPVRDLPAFLGRYGSGPRAREQGDRSVP